MYSLVLGLRKKRVEQMGVHCTHVSSEDSRFHESVANLSHCVTNCMHLTGHVLTSSCMMVCLKIGLICYACIADTVTMHIILLFFV